MKRINLTLTIACSIFTLLLLLPRNGEALTRYLIDEENFELVAKDISTQFGTPYESILNFLGNQVNYHPINTDIPHPKDFLISSETKRHIQFTWAAEPGQESYHGSYYNLLTGFSNLFQTDTPSIDLIIPEGYQYHVYAFTASKNRLQSITHIFIVDRDAFFTGGTPDQPLPNTDKFEAINSLSLYPNPARSQSSLSFQLKETSNVAIEVYSLQGQRLQTSWLAPLHQGRHEVPIDLSQLQPGIYYIQLQINHQLKQIPLMLGK